MANPLSSTCVRLRGRDWEGPVVVTDLAPQCCAAHSVPVRPDRSCIVVDNVLSKAECLAIMEAALPHHEQECPSGPSEPGVRSQFSNMDEPLSNLVWERIHGAVPAELDGGHVVGLEGRWRHAKYWPGQSVMAHMDFRHGSTDDVCVASRISFTLYLNDDFDGGETAFVTGVRLDGSHAGEHYSNKPRAGSAVFFYQCIPEFSHTGNEVRGGCKSIMRADVLYRFADSAAANVGGLHVD